jgi:hypothetical protein
MKLSTDSESVFYGDYTRNLRGNARQFIFVYPGENGRPGHYLQAMIKANGLGEQI